jgi:hypothetical protein
MLLSFPILIYLVVENPNTSPCPNEEIYQYHQITILQLQLQVVKQK